MFRLHVLPAFEGDCLILEYGDAAAPRRILVDGGHTETADAIAEYFGDTRYEDRRFEVVVVSHIDNDHIEGVLSYLTRIPMENVGDIWFNAPRHFEEEPPEPDRGPKAVPEGDRLVELLEATRPWNEAFDGKAVASWCHPVWLQGGLTLTVVSPDLKGLRAMVGEWEAAMDEEGLSDYRPRERSTEVEPFTPPAGIEEIRAHASSDFEGDGSKKNHSSIALLAEFEGKRVLLSADAHSRCLKATLTERCGASATRPIPIDVVKLPHHGSEHNLSNGLLDVLESSRFVVSTNSLNHGHPDIAAIARIVTRPGQQEVLFNYRTPQTECWDNEKWQRELDYRTVYPKRDGWLTVEI